MMVMLCVMKGWPYNNTNLQDAEMSNAYELPKYLILSKNEEKNIRRGGKICMISLAAGNGHKEMASRVKTMLLQAYPTILSEDSFLDPNNSAASHPGVKMWNRWQKSEYISGLLWMVRLQKMVDKFHYWGVRLGLCRQLMETGIAKVIDTQTNSTEAICEAVGDYNDILRGHTANLPLEVGFFHALMDKRMNYFVHVWQNREATIFYKIGLTLLYASFVACQLFLYPIQLLLNLVYSLFSKPVPLSSQVQVRVEQEPVGVVKILTDAPIFDSENSDLSTINYFNSLSVLPRHVIERCELSVISPPLSPSGDIQYFSTPWSKNYSGRVYFTTSKDALVREGFKLSGSELQDALCDGGRSTYDYLFEKNLDTVYLSAMLGGNGGESLFSYVRSLAVFLQSRAKEQALRNKKGACKIHFTIFCGRNEAVVKNILTFASSADCPKNLTVNPMGFITDEKVIAATIRQADIHITRPGGISTFELDVMSLSGTEVIFHTPQSELGNTPSLSGLLQWECSNALWYLSRRYSQLGVSLQDLQDFVEECEVDNQQRIIESVSNQETLVANHHVFGQERESLKKLLQQFLVTDNFLVEHPIFSKVFNKISRGVDHDALTVSVGCRYRKFTSSLLMWNKVLSNSFQTTLLRNFWTALCRVRRSALDMVPVGTSGTSLDPLRSTHVYNHKKIAGVSICQNGYDSPEKKTSRVRFGPKIPPLLVR